MILQWHLLNNERATPSESLVELELIVKIRFMQEDELVMCVGWSVSWLYPVVDVNDSISCPPEESLSSAHHLQDLALR